MTLLLSGSTNSAATFVLIVMGVQVAAPLVDLNRACPVPPAYSTLLSCGSIARVDTAAAPSPPEAEDQVLPPSVDFWTLSNGLVLYRVFGLAGSPSRVKPPQLPPVQCAPPSIVL